MNLLIINSAKEWGGTEKWALRTAEGLAERGHAVFFGCRGGLFDARLRSDKVRLVKFPLANNADAVTFWKIGSFLRRSRIDAVLPSKQREYLLAGLAAKLLSKAKVAGMFGIDRPIHNLRNRLAFCRIFDMVFVVAEKIIPTLSKTRCFDPAKCRVVYVGVEPVVRSAGVRAERRKALGLDEKEICVMGIGRLAPQKGFDYAIGALALLDRKYRLVIAGGGDASACRQLAEKAGIADRIVFTGFRDDIPQLIQAADIFWLTSRSEGIPNTMLEAMAAAVPVVAFDIAGVGEVVRSGENGLLVPFEDIRGLAAATERFMSDPGLRRRLAEAGLETVTTRFSLKQMVDDTERYLKELCGRS